MMLSGDNGILNRGAEAKTLTNEAQLKEELGLAISNLGLGYYSTHSDGTLKNYIFDNVVKLRTALNTTEEDLTVSRDASTINYKGTSFVIDDNGNVTKVQEGITITNGDITLAAEINDQIQLTATKVNTDVAIIWTSSNPNIATVDNTGKVTALAAGTALITASGSELRKKL